MGDSYIECLVSRDKNMKHYILRIVMYVLCAVFVILGLLGMTPMLILGIVFLLVGLFVIPNPDIEYEYLLIGKDLSIDTIIAKEKRKHAASYDLNKLEIMCPVNSHELDSYRNKKTPVKDFSSGRENEKPYVIVYHDEKGDLLLYVQADPQFISAVKTVCPRKVVEY